MSNLITQDAETRIARTLRAAWYRLPNCPGELYAAEARALAKAVIAALGPDTVVAVPSGGTLVGVRPIDVTHGEEE